MAVAVFTAKGGVVDLVRTWFMAAVPVSGRDFRVRGPDRPAGHRPQRPWWRRPAGARDRWGRWPRRRHGGAADPAPASPPYGRLATHIVRPDDRVRFRGADAW